MIRPVEMQMLLPRTESVGSTQQYENQKVVNENAYAAPFLGIYCLETHL